MQVPVTSLTCLHADRRRRRLSISQVVTALSSQALLFYACKRIHEENEGKNCSRERKVHAQNERYKERYFHESFVPWNFQIPILCNFRSLELSLSKKETITELSFPNCAYRRGAIKNQRQSIEMFERRLAYLLPFISYTLVCCTGCAATK